MPSLVLHASGSNAHGQLANGTLDDSHTFGPCIFSGVSKPGVLPVSTQRISSIASGANHTLVILERLDDAGRIYSELWGCGDGAKGQLGPSYSKTCKAVFRPIELPLGENGHGYSHRLVAAAWETTYVVFSYPDKNDILISMGADDFGDLGIGGTGKGKQVIGPLNIVKFDHLTPPGTTKLVIRSLAAGPHHIIVDLNATLADGSTRSSAIGWGASRHGQLGKVMTSALAFQAAPQDISTMLPAEDAVAACGHQHSVFLHTSGRVSCLGSDRKCQLQGIGDVKDVRALGCTWYGTYLVTETDGESRIITTGSHSRGQLGRDLTSANDGITAAPVQFPFTSVTCRLLGIACGSEHVLSLFAVTGSSSDDAGTEVWGWGWNEHGNLGLGMTCDVVLPTKIWPVLSSLGTRGGRAVGIWAGCGTSWIAIEC